MYANIKKYAMRDKELVNKKQTAKPKLAYGVYNDMSNRKPNKPLPGEGEGAANISNGVARDHDPTYISINTHL